MLHTYHTYLHTHTHTHIHTHTHTYTYTQIYIYIYTYIHIHTYTYIHIYIHTYIYTTYIIDIVFKIDLNTIAAQLVFFLRVKLWKVIMRCKYVFLRLQLFFLLILIQSTQFFQIMESECGKRNSL